MVSTQKSFPLVIFPDSIEGNISINRFVVLYALVFKGDFMSFIVTIKFQGAGPIPFEPRRSSFWEFPSSEALNNFSDHVFGFEYPRITFWALVVIVETGFPHMITFKTFELMFILPALVFSLNRNPLFSKLFVNSFTIKKESGSSIVPTFGTSRSLGKDRVCAGTPFDVTYRTKEFMDLLGPFVFLKENYVSVS